jgi:hypothetical protein
MKTLHYILNSELVPVSCEDIKTWARWMETAERTLAKDKTRGGVLVSTVFLGLDHNFTSYGPAVLYETMIFCGPLDLDQARYSTYADAMAGHKEMFRQALHAELLQNQTTAPDSAP